MKEFIEKLIEEMKSKAVPLGFGLIPDEKVIREADAIEIVNQLAEEYKEQNNDQDLMIVESLPSVYPLQPFEVEAIDRVVSNMKKVIEFIKCILVSVVLIMLVFVGFWWDIGQAASIGGSVLDA